MSDFSAETPLVTARIEFVLKRMQGNIVQMMQDHTGEINKHMEEAVAKALDPRVVNQLIRQEIEKQLVFVVQECTREAIQQNWELRKALVQGFKETIVAGVKAQLERGVYGGDGV